MLFTESYTAVLFLLLTILAIIVWAISFIKPSMLSRRNVSARKSRKRVKKISLLTVAVSLVLSIITAPGTTMLEKAISIQNFFILRDYEVAGTFIYTSKTMDAEVTSVIDGDTFRIRTNEGDTEKVRLLLIDTPEIGEQPEPYALEARDYTKELLDGQTVHLEFDESERDQYGRLLAYVYVNDQMVNQLLLEKGLARVAVFPPDTLYLDDFRMIESRARESGLRIWSIDNYVTNRGFNTNAAASGQ
ncbi:thermonuclease family protein [Paenibacillus sp. FSL R7-0331]|uniref:thermonuclease family protein n=1 Tax=Paenibacillus sp. FSL R7-0331 TaxID=1536773 RepID=UPI000693D667|nr:thermonuclease family protein [Paenibacillus sp. FSL R7-0331]